MEHLKNANRKGHPFTTPDGYFDGLASRIQQRTEAPQANRRWLSASSWRMAMLPTLALLIIGWAGYQHVQSEAGATTQQAIASTSSQILAEVSAEDIANYLASDAGFHTTELDDLSNSAESSQALDSEDALQDALLDEVDIYELDEYL